MAMPWWKRVLTGTSRPARNEPRRVRPALALEPLGERVVPAVTAVFAPGAGILSIFGDSGDNSIVVSRDAAGHILVNGGAVRVVGGTPTVTTVGLIQAFGQAGNDTISLDEANGALPKANLFGGAGNDTLTGGSGADQLFGQAGNDTLLGKGGNDSLLGGAGNDALTGGKGDDRVFGEAGDDRMIWNPGDGSALNEGGAGNDTVEVIGGNVSEAFLATAVNDRILFERVSPAPFTIDIGTSENLVLTMNGGDDSFAADGNIAGLSVEGGAGNDTIFGGAGSDRLSGGDGNDLINGGRGNDVASLGAGDDTFVWNPGDGSDAVEGQDGTDTMRFNGADVNENVDISANGSRVLFFRDPGNITMNTAGVEVIDFAARGGVDNVAVHDLSGTGVTAVKLDLAGTPGSGVGDGQIDTVVVEGTAGADNVFVAGSGTNFAVGGLSAPVTVTGSEGANDQLVVKGLGGDDTLSAAALPAGVVNNLTLDGGTGDDVLRGSQGVDFLFGGDGNDFIDGNQGADSASLGAGDDVFQWDPGDGSDTVEGQDGHDAMLFNGANVDETVDLSADGRRVRFFRNPGTITMDLSGVEEIDFNANGGTDSVTVNDLSGTDVTGVNINLASNAGVSQPASVVVNGTAGDDNMSIIADAAGVSVFGLAATITIAGAEAAHDRLTVHALAGDDVVDASGLAGGAIQFAADGGGGNDILIGGAGNDTLAGGAGDDVLIGGPGQDVLDGGPGDNTLFED